ncbi:hypothetical protein NY2A_b879R [Paramecium bursaria Chlorella virus NY2A]|uniref:Uncharacterized protein b879R n=1 Tax=Paramecium bursaria Chlorella virus NY2A TaxID=46021 RepID=A7IY54_PBCVN|nr:hypothetical protein NY2A_b879R [Paramecium bursaria Chlorella virus NY2A]ABT15278.1 hypothetical protein NY2A_b879R [Paramecium bursaria Chlorella virus NY2A]
MFLFISRLGECNILDSVLVRYRDVVLIWFPDYLPLFVVDFFICLIRKSVLFVLSPNFNSSMTILRSIRFREQFTPLLCCQLIFREEIVRDESSRFICVRTNLIIILSRLIEPSQIRQIVIEFAFALDVVGGERHIRRRTEKRRKHCATQSTSI